MDEVKCVVLRVTGRTKGEYQTSVALWINILILILIFIFILFSDQFFVEIMPIERTNEQKGVNIQTFLFAIISYEFDVDAYLI